MDKEYWGTPKTMVLEQWGVSMVFLGLILGQAPWALRGLWTSEGPPDHWAFCVHFGWGPPSPSGAYGQGTVRTPKQLVFWLEAPWTLREWTRNSEGPQTNGILGFSLVGGPWTLGAPGHCPPCPPACYTPGIGF